MQFAVPSKGRAGSVKTADVLSSCVLYVPRAEADDYRKSNPGQKVVGVPTRVKGITPTRNWILDNCGDERVVMIDDDVKVQGWVQMGETSCKHVKLAEEDWARACYQLFNVLDGLKWYVFGVSTQDAPRSVYPFRPFLSRSYVTGSFMGIKNDGTYRFDESFIVKEDYELTLRHIKEQGGILCARHIYWSNHHWDDEGGCKEYRTQGIEADCIARLIKMYPGLIRQVTRGGSSYSIELEF